MKPFEFSFRALLTLREQQEQVALQDYAKALQARERALSALQAAEEDSLRAWGLFQEKLAAKSSVGELARIRQLYQDLAARRLEQAHLAEAARQRANETLLQFLAAGRLRVGDLLNSNAGTCWN